MELFLRILCKDREHEFIFSPKIIHLVFREFWDWVLKGVTAAVQPTEVMQSNCLIVKLTCESFKS